MTTATSSRFAAYDQNLNQLNTIFPPLYRLITAVPALDALDDWTAAMRRYEAIRQQGGQPVLVGTLYGPSGAGKSTLFRALTGVDVPIGEVRPMTRNCVAGVPPELSDPSKLAVIFPDFRIETLHDLDQLKEPGIQADHLFVAIGQSQTGQTLPFILGDVPDFNSIEAANWERAERMMRRSEVVVFVTYTEGYADQRTIQELARCCRLAARLVYIINKVPRPEAAQQIWHSLPRQLGEGSFASTFLERRADGQTLLEFLQASPAYYWPYSFDAPDANTIQPIRPQTPPLRDLLGGLAGEAIVLAGLMEPVQRLTGLVRGTVSRVSGEIEKLERDLVNARQPIAEASQRVAGEEFPIGRFLELMSEEVMGGQSSWLGWAWGQMTGLFSSVVSMGKQLLDSLNGSTTTTELQPRHEIERKALAAQSESLFDRWRMMFPHSTADEGSLTTERISSVRNTFQEAALPEPNIEWETMVRAEARKWAEDNPTLRKLLPIVLPVGAAVLAAWVIPGGLVAGLIAGGVGLAGGGLLANLIVHLQLSTALKAANDAWTRERQQQLREHLETNLYGPVFAPWQERLIALKTAPVAACLAACASLEALAVPTATGPDTFVPE